MDILVCPVCSRPFESSSEIVLIKGDGRFYLVTKYGKIPIREKVTADILALLLRRSQPVTAQYIIDAVYAGASDPVSQGTLRMRLWRLRKRLAPIGVMLARGVKNVEGYKLMLMPPALAKTYAKNPVRLAF